MLKHIIVFKNGVFECKESLKESFALPCFNMYVKNCYFALIQFHMKNIILVIIAFTVVSGLITIGAISKISLL